MTRPAILDQDVVVVPREPTEDMAYAGMRYPNVADMAGTYRAMLAASPHASAWEDVRAYVGELETRLEELESERVEQCDRCQGNGEIVTDWERYKHSHEGDVGDEAVAECPDCNGEGYIDRAEAAEARISELEARLKEAEREKARMVEALTPSGDTKAAYSGEFKMPYSFWDDDHEADRSVELMIPWTQIKEIMSAIRTRTFTEGGK